MSIANSKKEVEENYLDLDARVTIKNIAGWGVGFARIETVGDVSIKSGASYRLQRSEIIAQVQNGNKLFIGLDGLGSHATVFIDDAATRREVGFDSEDGKTKQVVFEDTVVTKLFAYKTQETFEKNLKETIKTRAEKFALIEAIKRLKINDFSKIRFAEQYTGYKVI